MTEQKREPKDGERWWVKNTLTGGVFMTSYHTSRSDPFVILAPVASHELVQELVEALMPFVKMDEALNETAYAFDTWHADAVVFSIGSQKTISVGNLRVARDALAKAKLAGLDVQS